MQVGIVDWFKGLNKKTNKENDYGFIRTTENSSVFVHESSLICEGLAKDDVVWFNIINDNKTNRPKAVNVTKLATDNFSELETVILKLQNGQFIETIKLLKGVLINIESLFSELVWKRLIYLREGRKVIETQSLLIYLVQEFKKAHSLDVLRIFKETLNEERYLSSKCNSYWNKIEMYHFTQIDAFPYEILPYNLQKQYLTIYAARNLQDLQPESLQRIYDLLGLPFDPFADFMLKNGNCELIDKYRKNLKLLKLNEPDLVCSIRNYDDKVHILSSYLSDEDLLMKKNLIAFLLQLVEKEPETASALPNTLKKESVFYRHLPPIEQVQIIWDCNDIDQIFRFVRLLRDEAKILLFYKMSFEKNYKKDILEALDKCKNRLVSSIFRLFQCINLHGEEKGRFFESFHQYLVHHFIDLIEANDKEYINIADRLFPICPMGVVNYCEARIWKENVGYAYCPRYKRKCTYHNKYSNRMSSEKYGAKIEADNDLDWTEWSLQEFLYSLRIEPSNLGGELRNPEEYVNRIGGWINRTIELKERLKCSHCKTPFKSNLTYAKNLAVYNPTVFHCIHRLNSEPHDNDTYISHCWACQKVIDSRDGSHRYENYYLCVECGSGPVKSQTFTQSDICPNCGEKRMVKSNHHRRGYSCRKCNHDIIIPTDDKLTGKYERIAAVKNEIYQKEKNYF